VSDEERAVIDRYRAMTGTVPVGLRDMLHVLAHPDVIVLTRAYRDSVDA
jgi:hypothetical protein